MIWHGRPYRREGAVVNEQPSSVFYQPEKYDIVGYHPEDGKLKIHASSARGRDICREAISEMLFGTTAFQTTDEYTLVPLQESGLRALACEDVSGIAWIKLKEIHYDWGGSEGEVEIRRAKDLFAAFERDGRRIEPEASIQSAKFSVAFRGGRRPRTVVLRPPNTVTYTRDPDSGPIE